MTRRSTLLAAMLVGLALRAPAVSAQQAPAPPSGDRGAAWMPTAALAFGAIGWLGLITALLHLRQQPRVPRALALAPAPLAAGLHPAPDGPAGLAALCMGHRLLLVGPVPSGLDMSAMTTGTVFSMGDGPCTQGALLEAREALVDRGAPLLVLVCAPILGLDGTPTRELGLFALRRLRLPMVVLDGLHTPSQFIGQPLANRDDPHTQRS